MKKKLLSIVLCFVLVAGCCVAFAPATVQAKKFSKKKVKIAVKKCKGSVYLPEDDCACKKVILVTNKNKKLADVTFDVIYYKGKGSDKKEVYRTSHSLIVAQVSYIGIGNAEEMPSFSSYKIKHIKIKKAKGKQISKKKVIIKNIKKQDGLKRISMKNNSKSDGVFERVRVYFNKKGKLLNISSTCIQELRAGEKVKIYNTDYSGKYYKMKTYYNYIKAKLD